VNFVMDPTRKVDTLDLRVTESDRASAEQHMNQRFSLTGRVQSFRHAMRGITLMLKSQHNAWIHATASVIILLAAALFGLSPGEWCWLVIAIMAVWTAEALNTALEFLANVTSPEFHPLVEKAKDVAAGAVLISATGSVVIAVLILGPYVLHFLHLVQS
jgi:diacylglycerol kinase (ATP)